MIPSSYRPMKSVFRRVLIALPGLLLFALSCRQVSLTTADLGRHLANGSLILSGRFQEVLHQNLYSFTYANHSFVNHHWLSGVLFQLIHSLGGFPALVIAHALILALALSILVIKDGRFSAVGAALLALPLIVFRNEIRPETLSYLFVAIFIATAESKRALYALPLLMAVWVNLHIYFFLGFVILGSFLVEAWLHRNRQAIRKFSLILCFCGAATFVNPLTYELPLYPLRIFSDYGYKVLENQSVFFFLKRGMMLGEMGSYLLAALILVTLLIFELRFKSWRRLRWSVLLPALFSGVMAFLAIRNFAIFGLILVAALPQFSFLSGKAKERILSSVGIVVLTTFLVFSWQSIEMTWGFDLSPRVNASAEFFKNAGIQGPIFNNYDIGGYLIYNLFPKESVFVDNRPEAYPDSFFEETYVPMQEQDTIWKEMADRFHFNCIYFYRHDQTSWAQPFLFRRSQDPDWVPVYVDDYVLILVKKNAMNQTIIDRYAIPRSVFRSSST